MYNLVQKFSKYTFSFNIRFDKNCPIRITNSKLKFIANQKAKNLNFICIIFQVIFDSGKATLIIPEAFPKDAGVYKASARNSAGEAASSCTVTVKGRLPTETSDSELASDFEPIKPAIQLQLKDVSILEGRPVRLDCVIIGQPEPEVNIQYHQFNNDLFYIPTKP